MVSKSHDYVDWDDLVPTPGGYQPQRLIFRTRRGEALSVAQWEGAHIVTRTKIDPSATGRMRVAPSSEKLFLTPGGYRHPSLVHHLEPNQKIQVTENGLNIVDNDLLLKEITIIGHSAKLPAIESGWIANAHWTHAAGNPISLFTSTWNVPEAPLTNSGQVIYLSNGMQYIHSVGPGMIQPVLQWQTSETGGEYQWSIACWYIDPSGIVVSSDIVTVNVGDTLVSTITLLSQSNGMFTYQAEFQGITETQLVIPDIPEVLSCYEVLEAYNIQQCSDYPRDSQTEFTNIRIETGNTTPSIVWTLEDRVSVCNQRAIVVSNSNPGGKIDIFYA